MITLKKFLAAAILPLYILILSTPVTVIKASSETYARILDNDVQIFQDLNLTEPIFTLPYSYYVKIEQTQPSSYRVSYGNSDENCPQIVGYVSTEKVTLVDYVPVNPYSVIKVSTDVSDILFNDFEQKTPYFNVPKNEVMYYYGEIKNSDKNLCYVYYAKKLGYVDKTCLNPFVVNLHPDEIKVSDEVATDGANVENQSAPSNALGENLQIIIIVGISVVSISVVYFLFKPSKNKTGEDQNEFSND